MMQADLKARLCAAVVLALTLIGFGLWITREDQVLTPPKLNQSKTLMLTVVKPAPVPQTVKAVPAASPPAAQAVPKIQQPVAAVKALPKSEVKVAPKKAQIKPTIKAATAKPKLKAITKPKLKSGPQSNRKAQNSGSLPAAAAKAVSPEPAPAAPAPAPDLTQINLAVSKLQQAVKAKLIYPKSAKRRGLSGQVTLKFSLKQGKVSAFSLQQSSGKEILDEAALRAGEKLQDFDTGIKADFSVSIPVLFKLRR